MKLSRYVSLVVALGVLAASLMGCGKERARPTPTPQDAKGVVDAALENLKTGNDFQRREAIMTLVSPPTPDDRILPALESALKIERIPALRTELINAIKRQR